MKKKRVLAVDDEEAQRFYFKLCLEDGGFEGELVMAKSVAQANELIADSIVKQNPFDLVFVDLRVGAECGGELARRIIDICKTNTVIVTGYPAPAIKLPFSPDSLIIKPYNDETLMALVHRLVTPLRVSADPAKLVLNLWEATKHLRGINSLKPFSYKMDEEKNVEKITGVSLRDDELVNCTVYTQPDIEKRTVNIGLSATLGCTERCLFCINWQSRRDKQGKSIEFLRKLTPDEIIAQVYLAMMSRRVKEAFTAKKLRLKVNFACEGDVIVNNFENGMIAIRQLAKIVFPEINFVITTTGDEANLDKYLKGCIELPRVSFYWSLTTANERVRNIIMPSPKRQSLRKIRDKFREIGKATGMPVTVNLIVIPSLTDSQEDADSVYNFLKDEKGDDYPFIYKVMALNADSLKGIKNPTQLEVDEFCKKLVKAGIDPKKIRKRKVRGGDIAAGCGSCVPDRGVESVRFRQKDP